MSHQHTTGERDLASSSPGAASRGATGGASGVTSEPAPVSGVIKSIDEVKFDKAGRVPAVIQEHGTGEVLMVGYMNRESLERTLATGLTWFYSRSRQRLWQKGETSGHVQRVKSVKADCDLDALLVEVEQVGPGACHTGHKSCFHHIVAGEGERGERDGGEAPSPAFDPREVYGDPIVRELYGVIESRKENPVQGSYTSYLFEKGLDKILKKVGEESTEVLIAAKNGDRDEFVAESADLIYHLLVAMVEVGVHPDAVWAELAKRRGGGGSEDAPPGK